MKESLIKPIHGMCYIGRISVDYHTATEQFFSLFNKFFDQKIAGEQVEVAYFKVSRLTDKQLEHFAQSHEELIWQIKDCNVTDFAVINGKYFLLDVSDCEINEKGHLIIDMSEIDEYGGDLYGYFTFWLNVDFNLPMRVVEL